MSLDGMWSILFTDVGDDKVDNSGVLVLREGQIYGGDSLVAYRGSYVLESTTFKAEARTWTHNDTVVVTTAFGTVGAINEDVDLSGLYNPETDLLAGSVWRRVQPEAKLDFVMRRLCDLAS